MKCRVARDVFLKGLQRIQGVVDKKSTMPILSNILLEAQENGIRMVATDLEMGIRGVYPAEIQEPGSVTLSAKKTYEIVRELTGEDVLLEADSQGHVTLRCERSEFRLLGTGKEDFPSLPDPEEMGSVELPPGDLKDMIRKTLFCVGESDTRYVLNGVYLRVGRGAEGAVTVWMVGTDGHRLAEVNRSVAQSASQAPQTTEVIVPRKAILELRRLLEDGEGTVRVGLAKNHVTFSMDHWVLISRLIEGNYPNYQQVIPSKREIEISQNRALLMGALRRVAIVAREKTGAVKLTLTPGSLLLHAENPDLGEAREELALPYEGKEVTIGFNARYLLEALAAMDQEEVTLGLQDPLSPCLITPQGDPGYRCVVMPMRI